MAINRIIFILGFLILLVPFVGFPRLSEEIFLFIAGALLMILSSLNIWQKSVLNRLRFHSKQLDTSAQADKDANASEENKEI